MEIFNKKISRKLAIVIIIVLLIIGYFIIKPLFKSQKDNYILEKADRGEVLQFISETGNVRATENISLGFKSIGKIQNINVAVGEEVLKGQILANMDDSQVRQQLRNYQAALDAAKAQYNKFIDGYTLEDIKVYKDAVQQAGQDLQTSYVNLVNVLNDTNIKIYNAYSLVDFLQKNHFERGDAESIALSESRSKIYSEFEQFKLIVAEIKSGLDETSIASNLEKAKNNTWEIKIALERVRDIIKPTGSYQNIIATSDINLMDGHVSYVNSALASITASQESLASYRIALQKAESNLNLRRSGRQEDIEVYRAQVEQAQANVNLYQSQLDDSRLISPIDGKITAINYKVGEVISPSQPMINLLSLNPFQIKTDIYEQDIINVKIDDTVEVVLIAFPRKTLTGKVVSIDPAEKIVDQVVYYEATIDFANDIEGIRSGMTADIIIHTSKKENVLRVPKSAVESIFGRDIVKVARGRKIEEREIQVGLEGEYYFEVISGLKEGDEIVIGRK